MYSEQYAPWRVSVPGNPDKTVSFPKFEHSFPPDPYGPWRYVTAESPFLAQLGGGFMRTLTPNHSYLGDAVSEQRTHYIVNSDYQSTATFNSIPAIQGGRFLSDVGAYLKEELAAENRDYFIGANIASYNRLLSHFTDPQQVSHFHEDPLRKKLAQSAPFIHFHTILFNRRVMDSLTSLDFNDPYSLEIVRSKFAAEMHIPTDKLTAEDIHQMLDLMTFDQPAAERWKKVSFGDWTNSLLIKSLNWRVPEPSNQPPYGLRLETDASDFIELFQRYGTDLWQIFQGLEGDLQNSGLFPDIPNNTFSLPSVNYCINFRRENGKAVIYFNPHDSLRVGSFEDAHIFVNRTQTRTGST